MKINAIITAGGLSQRYGDKNKLFEKCRESTVIVEAIKPFLQFEDITKIIVGIETSFADELDRELDLADLKDNNRIVFSVGGKTRTQTVKNALIALEHDADAVLVHDGARPYVTTKIISDVIASTKKFGVALPVINPTDATVNLTDNATPLDRAHIGLVQTPFGAKKEIFQMAYSNANEAFYDDLSVIKTIFDGEIGIVEGDRKNIKITYGGDIREEHESKFVTGCGYDIHRLKNGNGIKLLGVLIPCNYSFVAHSDGDVPVHAVMDAILSAIGEKDIGHLFPVDDAQYDNADSLELLFKVLIIAREKGYKMHNMTVSIIAERPMLAPHIDQMRVTMSNLLGLPLSRIGISATTNEQVGDIGSGNAIAAYATVLLKKIR